MFGHPDGRGNGVRYTEMHEVEADGGRDSDEETPQDTAEDEDQTTQVSSVGSENEQDSAEVVQFTASMVFTTEDSKKAVVDVMRIGTLEGTSTVRYETQDGSALDGKKYEARRGKITFGPGEALQSFEVPIIDDDSFDTTLEFKINLKDPRGCSLGHILKMCRVIIIDDDTFPANDYKERIDESLAGDSQALRDVGVGLLISYLVFVFKRVPGVKWRTIVRLMLDQFDNAYYLLMICLRVYLVDRVLNFKDKGVEETLLVPGHRQATAMILALAWVLPKFVLCFIDWLKAGPLNISQAIITHHRVNLFRKYLNYSQSSRTAVPVQDLTLMMNSDIPDIYEKGYATIFDLIQSCGKIACVAVFMISRNPKSALPILLYPMIFLTFTCIRQKKGLRLAGELGEVEASTQTMIVDAVLSFSLTNDYRQRPAVVDRYEQILRDERPAVDAVRKFSFNNEQLLPWLTLICIGGYMYLGAGWVIDGTATVGGFLATINVYKDLGDRFEGIYSNLRSLLEAIDPLLGLTEHFARATDVQERMERSDNRRKYTHDKLDELSHHSRHSAEDRQFFDKMPITIEKLTIANVPGVTGFSQEVEQGHMVLITGEHGSGKASLLDALADNLKPESGQVVYASHLRCLHVAAQTQVLHFLNLWENLTFGTPDATPDRVKKICQKVGCGKVVLDELDSDIAALEADGEKSDKDEDAPAWYDKMSSSDRKRVHLARAFIYNPEILALHRPTDGWDQQEISRILTLLKEFTQNRGLESQHVGGHRRPRSVFFTGGDVGVDRLADAADVVWNLKHNGMRTQDKMGVSKRMQMGARQTPLSSERSGALTRQSPRDLKLAPQPTQAYSQVRPQHHQAHPSAFGQALTSYIHPEAAISNGHGTCRNGHGSSRHGSFRRDIIPY